MAKQTFTTGQVLTAAQVNSLQTNDFNQTVSAKTASYVLVAADKGTRIEFNTSGSVTCTVNTGLFDAGDTLIVQNRGAGAVTITAGTATVNTAGSLVVNQYESGTLYFISASAALWFGSNPGDITGITTGATSGLTGGVTSGTADLKFNTTAKGGLLVGTGAGAVTELSVGANNTVLTADSATASGLKWATSSSGGFTLLSTTTLNSSNQVISSIDQTYTHLFVTIQGMTNATANGGLRVDCNSNASSAYFGLVGGDNATARTAAVQAGQIDVGSANLILRTSANNAWAGWFYNYSAAEIHPFNVTFTYQNDTNNYTYAYAAGSIQFGTAAAISSIRFNNYGGAFSGGTVRIYGVK